ncbi:MAG: hypothetical protein RIA64_10445 [Rhodospirillales bacterium]
MPGFIKSTLIASTVAAGTVGSVAAIGTEFDFGFGKGEVGPVDPGPSVVRMAPISIQIGGWTLKKKKNEAKVLIVSITLDVPSGEAKETACRLMPRLVSAVNSEVSREVLYQATWKQALEGSLGQRLQTRFNRALGRTVISKVSLQAYGSEYEAPQATCPATA